MCACITAAHALEVVTGVGNASQGLYVRHPSGVLKRNRTQTGSIHELSASD